MTRIFGLGEIVYDVLFKNMQPLAAKAGGSVLNALVSLARVGREVYMISETGSDLVGDAIISFLKENNVNTNYINRFDGRSTLALAYLNDKNEAQYQFYKDKSTKKRSFNIPDFSPGDILLFGSFYGINPEFRPDVLRIVNKAKDAGATVYYDPNFRAAHLQHGNKAELVRSIEENFSLADIIRGSDEDFLNIYDETSPQKIYEKVSVFCPNLIITAGASKVHAFSKNTRQTFDVPEIETVSTVGAGDNFNAGVIHALLKESYSKDDGTLEIKEWEPLIRSGIRFSSAVCQTLDNYIPEGFTK
jgi:fructokinase